MKKISLICLALIASCNDVNIKNTDTVQKIKIDYYSSKETKELDFPFSDATIVNNIIYVAGQVGNLPGTNKVVEGGIRAETRQTMKNIENILKEAGLIFDNVVRTKIYLTNMDDFSAVNRVYGSYFKSNPPARTTIEVSGLPLGVNVEIDMIAVFSD